MFRILRRALVATLALASIVATEGPAAAQPLTAELTVPAAGATSASLLQPFQWTAVPNVQRYYLYVGTTPGAKNLINTGEISTTSYPAPLDSLPAGVTLYARMWAKVGDIWRFTDSSFTFAPLTATLIYPAAGATSAVDMTIPFSWSAVAGAEAYYLYVGTSVGAKDLVNSGERQATSYLVKNVPEEQTVYVRLWTKAAGRWRFVDSTFSAAATVARFTYPVPGTPVNHGQPWTWTTVPNVQAYYLYVGTTPGAKDLVNTGEIQATSYLPRTLAPQTVFARLWAKSAGIWRFTDATFVMPPLAPTLTFPADGASVTTPQPFSWTAVHNVQVYYLYVGTTQGAKDLVNTGEMLQTTRAWPPTLPPNQTLYARVWAKVAGVWRFTDSTFSVAAPASLVHPADGASGVDRTQLAAWTDVPSAEGYRLAIGGTPGTSDFLDTGEIQQTTASIANVPIGQTLYARLYTKTAAGWLFSDSTFTAAPLAPVFLHPLDGQVGVDVVSQPFSWTTAAGASAYRLDVGTTAGGTDLLSTSELAGTTHLAALATGGVHYARVWAKVNGVWARHSDIQYSVDAAGSPAVIVEPVDGESAFNTIQPLEWNSVPMGRGYRLTIGTSAGSADLHDSGEIRATQRFVAGLPIAQQLYGRVHTRIGGQWFASDFTFTVGVNATSFVAQAKAALWATDFVRGQATDADRPYGWSLLESTIGPRYQAGPADYAALLLQTLAEVNVGAATRRRDMAFTATGHDGHSVVEMLDAGSGRRMVLDPTYNLAVKRSDGQWATAEEVSTATRTLDWAEVSYLYLGLAGDTLARSAYLDYPLFYLNLFDEANPLVQGQGHSPAAYLAAVTLPYSGAPDEFVIQCSGSASADLVVDGVTVNTLCNGVDATSAVFHASAVAAAPGSAVFSLFRVNRFVFLP